MSQPRRIQTPGILFHVYSRGNAQQTLFFDQNDFQLYLGLLRKYKLKHAVKVYHFALMSNHVHLLIEPTLEDTISRFMQGVSLCYARYFNEKYAKVGHAWQSRYCSIPIETESYYLRCAQYIELNPVRAGIVKHPSEYEWTSYAKSIGVQSPGWTDIHPLLIKYQQKQQGVGTMYESIIEQEIKKIQQNKHERFSVLPIYGSEEFINQYQKMMESKPDPNLIQT